MATIKKRPDGRWLVRWRDPNSREHVRTFDKRVDADVFAKTIGADLLRGGYVDPRRSTITMGEWSQRWMASRAHLKPKTLVGYQSLLRTQIDPAWKNVRLAAVSHGDVAAWVANMRATVSASRTRQAFHLFHSMLDAAVLDRRLASNPATGVSLPRLPRVERRYLHHREVDALATACGDFRPLVLTLAYTGLRWGEAAALRVRNLDTMRARIRVVEAVTEVNGALVVGPPKTHQERTVPVAGFLRDLLAEHIAGRDQDALVFPARRGGTLRAGSFRRTTWNDACISVGLGLIVKDEESKRERYVGLVPHELRHTAASLAISAGASVKGVQAMLGHSSATLTLDRYGHLFADELDAVADRMHEARTSADFSRTSTRSTVRELNARTA